MQFCSFSQTPKLYTNLFFFPWLALVNTWTCSKIFAIIPRSMSVLLSAQCFFAQGKKVLLGAHSFCVPISKMTLDKIKAESHLPFLIFFSWNPVEEKDVFHNPLTRVTLIAYFVRGERFGQCYKRTRVNKYLVDDLIDKCISQFEMWSKIILNF